LFKDEFSLRALYLSETVPWQMYQPVLPNTLTKPSLHLNW